MTKVAAIALAALCAAGLASPAVARPVKARPGKPVQPMAANFDLARVNMVSREEAAPADPVPPKGVDMRDIAWDPPMVEVEVGKGGPVIGVGALGSRRKGVPKLAHVSMHFSF